jgi:hypothetical protein
MNCTINSASNFSGLQAGISQISPAQLAAPVRKSTLNRPIISPILRPDTEVVCFNNLGADALLVVPCPISASANYSHIGAFHRSAPQGQLHTFWKVVAQSVLARLGPQPLWLSTAGGGVDWLHMRLDDRPKYYRHLPWRDWRKA